MSSARLAPPPSRALAKNSTLRTLHFERNGSCPRRPRARRRAGGERGALTGLNVSQNELGEGAPPSAAPSHQPHAHGARLIAEWNRRRRVRRDRRRRRGLADPRHLILDRNARWRRRRRGARCRAAPASNGLTELNLALQAADVRRRARGGAAGVGRAAHAAPQPQRRRRVGVAVRRDGGAPGAAHSRPLVQRHRRAAHRMQPFLAHSSPTPPSASTSPATCSPRRRSPALTPRRSATTPLVLAAEPQRCRGSAAWWSASAASANDCARRRVRVRNCPVPRESDGVGQWTPAMIASWARGLATRAATNGQRRRPPARGERRRRRRPRRPPRRRRRRRPPPGGWGIGGGRRAAPAAGRPRCDLQRRSRNVRGGGLDGASAASSHSRSARCFGRGTFRRWAPSRSRANWCSKAVPARWPSAAARWSTCGQMEYLVSHQLLLLPCTRSVS